MKEKQKQNKKQKQTKKQGKQNQNKHQQKTKKNKPQKIKGKKQGKSNKPQNNDSSVSNKLFGQLEPYKKYNSSVLINQSKIHPAIIELGPKFGDGSINGSNARCHALLLALKEVIKSYKQPKGKKMSRDFSQKLTPMIDYLKLFRPNSIAIGNVLNFFKSVVHHLDGNDYDFNDPNEFEIDENVDEQNFFGSDQNEENYTGIGGFQNTESESDSPKPPEDNFSLKSTSPISPKIRQLHRNISLSKDEMIQKKHKQFLIHTINQFIDEKMVYAKKGIVKNTMSQIKENDKILIYSSSHLIQQLLIEAKMIKKKNFSVVVVDSGPKNMGRKIVKSLSNFGIECEYVLVSGLPYVIKNVSKVILSAKALLSNGYLISKVGTACVCMVAEEYKIPVLVCCETFKFSEKSQLDSITRNELLDPNDLTNVKQKKNSFSTFNSKILETILPPSSFAKEKEEVLGEIGEPEKNSKESIKNWKNMDNLYLLNLVYDVTPIEYISMVITEVGCIPPTSVSTVIHESFKNLQYKTE